MNCLLYCKTATLGFKRIGSADTEEVFDDRVSAESYRWIRLDSLFFPDEVTRIIYSGVANLGLADLLARSYFTTIVIAIFEHFVFVFAVQIL